MKLTMVKGIQVYARIDEFEEWFAAILERNKAAQDELAMRNNNSLSRVLQS